MYADDTLILFSGDNLNDLIYMPNNELALLFIWLKSNKSPPLYLLFHRVRINGNNSVAKINDCVIKRVNNMKYLGVIIDHKPKWCEHISYVKNKVSKGLCIFFKVGTLLDEK